MKSRIFAVDFFVTFVKKINSNLSNLYTVRYTTWHHENPLNPTE